MPTKKPSLTAKIPKSAVIDSVETPATAAARASEAAPLVVVGVGASAGGVEAFGEFFTQLPADTGMAFVVIQHLDPTHDSHLDAALARSTAMPVCEATDGTTVEPNRVYVIPPDADLGMRGRTLTLTPRSPDAPGLHLPIDTFFRALAAECQGSAFGVVLTGNASDGTNGLRAIKAEDGITFAQDPRTAKFPGMPSSARDAGVVDHCLPIPALAAELVRASRHPYVAAPASDPVQADVATRRKVFALLKSVIGVDYEEFKANTVDRRLARRMALRHAHQLSDYLTLLQSDPKEIRALHEDILIHVTSFFRDPLVFADLRATIFPEILKQKEEGAPVRIWAAGCATGEEAYSLAITLLECLDDSRPQSIQIFGSDLSEWAIQKARAGVYPDSALATVTDERRRRFFTKVDRGYRINKAVRDLCVFVRHDLARDPPFSKLDLVSCRNVLIYFGSALQKRVLSIFHYCLHQPGFLLLGRTESLAGFAALFAPSPGSRFVFARSAAPSTLRFAPHPTGHPSAGKRGDRASVGSPRRGVDVARHLDRLLLARYAPPGVLINDRLEVLQFRGQTGAFLQPAAGEPQANLVSMARAGLLPALRATMAAAQKDKAPSRTAGVEVDQGEFTRRCDLVVVPFVGLPDATEELFMVLFEEPAGVGKKVARRAEPKPDQLARERRRVAAMEYELAATKQYLQSLIEDHGQTSDDLGSANEELVSGNEELQSMNEELETAKEELQSTNEELSTVNDELHTRNAEISLVNSDLMNLLSTVDMPVIILDSQRRIRRLTPKARSILSVLPSDEGRLFDDIRPNINVPNLEQEIATVISTSVDKEAEVQDRSGHWYRMQIRPYRNTEDKIDGAILSLVDIDALKHHIAEAQSARAEAELANRGKDEFLATLSHELRTPLSTMSLQAQMLRRGGLPPERIQRAGEAIERCVRLQVQLIDDLLDVSRIVSGKLRVEDSVVDLRTVVTAAIEGINGLGRRKKLKWSVGLGTVATEVRGDATRLEQVVSNLLTNAIKFTPEGGQITVTLESGGGEARLRVTDNGVGIEAGFLPRVFERFAQQDSSTSRAHGGLGLGLAIVRHLVEAQGGTVRAESEGVGRGASFVVTLRLVGPTADPTAEAPSAVPSPAEAPLTDEDSVRLRGLRVLVVDDDVNSGDAVAELLTLAGATVRVARSAAEGFAAVGEFRPEVLLSDIGMPGEDGYSLIRRTRALGPAGGGDLPAIALTAFASAHDHDRALAAGFQVHLTKPVDGGHLVRVMAGLTAARRGSADPPTP